MTAHPQGVFMVHRKSSLALLAVLLVVTFAAGATSAWAVRRTICEVQTYDAEGLSPYVGQSVTVRGVIILPPGYLVPAHSSFYIQQDECGINVFCYEDLGFAAALGDSVECSFADAFAEDERLAVAAAGMEVERDTASVRIGVGHGARVSHGEAVGSSALYRVPWRGYCEARSSSVARVFL